MTLRRVLLTGLVVLITGCVRSPTDPPPDTDDDGQVPEDEPPTALVEPVSPSAAGIGIFS